MYICHIAGMVKIDSPDAYSLKFHADSEWLKETITKHGKKGSVLLVFTISSSMGLRRCS
jgi:hypothetical protein